MTPSLYIHIPFCVRKCSYCDFYSEIHDGARSRALVEAVIRQAEALPEGMPTVYIGGGTPTVLPVDTLGLVLERVGTKAGDGCEWTVEANPESLDAIKARTLIDCGVNRISIGVQSFNDRTLKRLGRSHTAAIAAEAVRVAAQAGFANISIDLIFGVWGDRLQSWKEEIDCAARLPITHVSCYELTYEKGTPLALALANRTITPLEEDAVTALYIAAIDRLAVRGFKQYEISNFAREGFECGHNMRYWRNEPYYGLGPSAHSYIDGQRSRNVADVGEYIRRIEEGKSAVDFSETLPSLRSAKETAAVKIRMREGIDFTWFKEKTGFDFMAIEKGAVDRLIAQGLIRYDKDGAAVTGISLKRMGILLADSVSSALL